MTGSARVTPPGAGERRTRPVGCRPCPTTCPGCWARVAAEHLAFCPDNVRQGSGSLAAYAQEIRGRQSWSFWWD
ncbi:DUF4253 domain-containing protein [Micromonospora carbonacea]|uniref:DUF4253 domain-containing protein n=1 Tax=Micromonospora carbonacea TaxID=47853 RepID=UPI0033335411